MNLSDPPRALEPMAGPEDHLFSAALLTFAAVLRLPVVVFQPVFQPGLAVRAQMPPVGIGLRTQRLLAQQSPLLLRFAVLSPNRRQVGVAMVCNTVID